MKKYNKSEIMKNAWDLIKRHVCSDMSDALTRAWWSAKQTVKTAVKKVSVQKHIVIASVEKWVTRKMSAEQFMALESGVNYANDVMLERETEKAIQISTEWNGYRMMLWLPKSATQYKFA